MKIASLKAFAAVMERGTLANAAQALNVSEPALSRQVSALERSLDLVLFRREQRRLVPTPAAEAFIREVQGLLGTLEQIPQIVRDIKQNPARRLRVVAMPRLTTAITAPAIAHFRGEHPDVPVSVDVYSRRFLEQWVAEQQFDIGFGSLPAQHALIETETLFKVPAVAVLPRDHRLANARRVTIRELADEPMIALSSNTLIRGQVDRIFERAGEPMRPAITVSQTHLACCLVAEGAGYTICDPLVVDGVRGRVATVPVHPTFHMSFGSLVRRDPPLSAEAEALVACFRDEAERFNRRLREEGA